jgi:hypothetical protein
VHDAGISLGQLNATQQSRTLFVKLVFVLISGAAAAVHAYWITPLMHNASHAKRAAAVGALGGTNSKMTVSRGLGEVHLPTQALQTLDS